MTERSLPIAPTRPPTTLRWPFFVAGGVAVAVAIAVGEIMAGLLPGAPSLVVSIGTLVIDLQPAGAKDLVVSLFGTNDKLALNVLILVVAVAVGGLLGLVARTRFATAVGAFIAFGVVALYASLRLGIDSPPLSLATVVLAVAAALASLRLLVDTRAWAVDRRRFRLSGRGRSTVRTGGPSPRPHAGLGPPPLPDPVGIPGHRLDRRRLARTDAAPGHAFPGAARGGAARLVAVAGTAQPGRLAGRRWDHADRGAQR